MTYPLDKTCVTIEPLDCQSCDDCGDDVQATKKVMLDLRGNGINICVGVYCDECGEEVADRLRGSLPNERPDIDCCNFHANDGNTLTPCDAREVYGH